MSYDLESVSLPRLEGGALALSASLLTAPVLGKLILKKLMHDAGFDHARKAQIEEPPSLWPLRPHPKDVGAPIAKDFLQRVPTGDAAKLPRPRVRDYAAAYRSGSVSPELVADRILAAIERADQGSKPLRAFISVLKDDVRAQAKKSAERHRDGHPLSILDGVPIALKDEMDQAGHPTTVGTAFRTQLVSTDSAIAEKLRALGAVLIGKANMHEIGINPTGINARYGQARNPYALDHDTGGSSSGSAAAVAAALCPIAIGADGGGSIRIPAGLCGIVGLKATFGRISERGVVPLCYSVGHAGPLAASVEDVAIAYAALAGPDPTVPETLTQPPPTLARYESAKIQGLRIGVYKPWFEHATADIVASCRAALDRLVARGATIVDIEIPELDAMRVAHAVTILSEMAASMHVIAPDWRGLGAIPRASLALTRVLTAQDFVWAQQVRTRAVANHARVFERCDVILTPATAITAPRVPQSGVEWSDLSVATELMRYVIAGNLCGYPGVVVPVGYDHGGLPIGMQVMAPHWEEDRALGVALALERDAEVRAPALSLSPL
ncbi:MAG: amidase [Deltaproteobacteria bacterium]|nr:amidase [Deltaproteobacteria bacterium]